MDRDLGAGMYAYIDQNDAILKDEVQSEFRISHRQVTKLCEAMAEYNRTHHTD